MMSARPHPVNAPRTAKPVLAARRPHRIPVWRARPHRNRPQRQAAAPKTRLARPGHTEVVPSAQAAAGPSPAPCPPQGGSAVPY